MEEIINHLIYFYIYFDVFLSFHHWLNLQSLVNLKDNEYFFFFCIIKKREPKIW